MILTRLGLDFAQTAPAGSEAKKKEQRLRRFIPYIAHYDAETLLTEDDQLIQIIKLEGLAFQTRDEEDLRRQKRFRNRLVRSIAKLSGPSRSRLLAIGGRPPDIINPPSGCKFNTRCPYVQPRCVEEEPPLVPATGAGHEFRCWIPVGTPENRAALEANQKAGLASAVAVGSV